MISGGNSYGSHVLIKNLQARKVSMTGQMGGQQLHNDITSCTSGMNASGSRL